MERSGKKKTRDNASVLERLKTEMRVFEQIPPTGISLMQTSRVQKLEALIAVIGDTPYEGGVFKLSITVPDMYPFQPPQVKFVTPIYHPNIDKGGRICLDALKEGHGWVPSLSIEKVLLNIQALMAEPNPDDPLDTDIAYEYKNNHQLFEEKARNLTRKHAMKHLVTGEKKTKKAAATRKRRDQPKTDKEPAKRARRS